MKRWLSVLFLLWLPAASAQVAKPGRPLSPSLPTVEQVKEALMQSAKDIEQQRRKLAEERQELEALRQEVANLLERVEQACKQKQPVAVAPQEPLPEQKLREQKLLQQLAESLSGMAPEVAATALAAVPQEIGVKLLLALDGRKAGKILSNMPPEKSADLMTAVLKESSAPEHQEKKP